MQAQQCFRAATTGFGAATTGFWSVVAGWCRWIRMMQEALGASGFE